MKPLIAGSMLLFSVFSVSATDFATEGMKYDDFAGQKITGVHILSERLQTYKAHSFKKDESILSVEFLGSDRTSMGMLEVTAFLRNRSNTPLKLEARTLFLGNGGMLINDESGWLPVFIGSNGTATYQERSIKTADVKHYRIEIRELR